jgi:hypothetical protein
MTCTQNVNPFRRCPVLAVLRTSRRLTDGRDLDEIIRWAQFAACHEERGDRARLGAKLCEGGFVLDAVRVPAALLR